MADLAVIDAKYLVALAQAILNVTMVDVLIMLVSAHPVTLDNFAIVKVGFISY